MMSLTGEQELFKKSDVKLNLCLFAGAGSGKTKSIIERVFYILYRWSGVSITIFSHTNATVDEISRRIREHTGNTQDTEIKVTTMHKYSLAFFKRIGKKPNRNLDYMLKEIAPLIIENQDFLEDVFIIDEAQDLSVDQMTIVENILKCGKSICLVGDTMQSIFSFQLARPSLVQEFRRSLPEAQQLKLSMNWRCQNLNILDMANELAVEEIQKGLAIHMKPNPSCKFLKKPDIVVEDLASITSKLKEIINVNKSKEENERESVVCLAHTNDKLKFYHAELMEKGIPTICFDNDVPEKHRVSREYQKGGKDFGTVILLFTIHGFKGGEAHHIYLLSGEDRGDEKELNGDLEGKRLMYTVVTRAISTLTIIVLRTKQLSRWLTKVLNHFSVAENVKKYMQSEPKIASSRSIFVTDVFKKGGTSALHEMYAGNEHDLYERDKQLLSDNKPFKHNHKIKKFNLEGYIGKVFELYASIQLDMAKSLQKRALNFFMEKGVGKLWVNKEIYETIKQQWESYSIVILEELKSHLKSALNDDEVLVTNYFMKHNLNKSLGSETLRQRYPSYMIRFFLERLHTIGFNDDYSCYFRRFSRSWDLAFGQVYDRGDAHKKIKKSEELVMKTEYWKLCSQAAFNLMKDGSYAECYLNRLASFFEYWESWERNEGTGMDVYSREYLHLTCRSLSVKESDLNLNTEVRADISQQARTVGSIIGNVINCQHACRVSFSARSYYEEAPPTARGTVCGYMDLLSEEGPVEIKACSQTRHEHAGQTIWYAATQNSSTAFLWNVLRKELFTFDVPAPNEFLCLALKHYTEKQGLPNYVPLGGSFPYPQMIVLDAKE